MQNESRSFSAGTGPQILTAARKESLKEVRWDLVTLAMIQTSRQQAVVPIQARQQPHGWLSANLVILPMTGNISLGMVVWCAASSRDSSDAVADVV